MFGRASLILLALIAVLHGCAQPKYENSVAAGEGTSLTGQGQRMGVTFAAAGMQMAWRWEKDPVGTEEGILLVRTYRASAVDGHLEPSDVSGDLAMRLWMPDMGHGSSPTTVERLRDDQGVIVPGAYRIRAVYFIMPGLWEMIFEIQQGGEVRDSAKVTLVRAS